MLSIKGMATLSLSNSVNNTLTALMKYVTNPEKTDRGERIFRYKCHEGMEDAEFAYALALFQDRTRKKAQSKIVAYNVIQSFVPGEITAEKANLLGRELADRLTDGQCAYLVCTHPYGSHIHNHIILSPVDLDCSCRMLCNRVRGNNFVDIPWIHGQICRENGLSLMKEPGSDPDRTQGAYQINWKSQLCMAIDRAMEKGPASWEELLETLRNDGWIMKRVRKTMMAKRPEWKRSIAMERLDLYHREQWLRDVLAGKKEHRPRKRAASPVGRTGRAAVGPVQGEEKIGSGAPVREGEDLSAQLRRRVLEADTAGIRLDRRRIEETAAYLAEKKVYTYGALCERAEEASKRFSVLADRIKQADTRMREIRQVQQLLDICAQSEEVYRGWKNSRFREKYRSAH